MYILAKKIAILGGVICVVAAAYLGATWWSGKLIEKNMSQNLALLNTQINQKLAGLMSVDVDVSDYQRHFLSSNLHYIVKAEGKKIKEEDLTLFHGPFPLSQVKKFDFSPAFFVFHHETQIIPSFINHKNINTMIDFKAHYLNQSDAKIATSEFDFPLGESILTFSPMQLDFSFKVKKDQSIFMKDFSSKIRSIAFKMGNQDGFIVNNFSSLLQTPKNDGFGTFKLNLDDISVNIPALDYQFLLKNMSLDIDGNANKGLTNQLIDYHIDNVKMGTKDLGSLNLNATLNNLPYAFLKSTDFEKINVKTLLSEFGQNKTALKINDFTWKNGNNSSKVNFVLDFAKTPVAASRYFIEHLKLNSDFSFGQLTGLWISQTQDLNSKNDNILNNWSGFAIMMAKGFLKEYLSTFNINSIHPFKLNGDKILIDFDYNAETNKVMLNDETYDADSVMKAFSFLSSEE